jgi:type I restriction enzyme, S subunit
MRNDWLKKTLGEVCVVERGSSPRPIERYVTDSPDGVNWVKIGDTKNVDKYIFSTRQKITKEGAEKSRRVDPGDFILTNSMSFGKPYVMATSGYIHDGWFVLRLSKSINVDFFHYLLASNFVQAQFLSLAAGSVVKNISKDLVKRAVLPIPPIDEQKRIVAIVDQAFEAIDVAIGNTKQNLANARELFESYLNDIFDRKGDGWVEKRLGDIATFRNGLNFTKASKGESIKIVGVRDFQNHFWIQEEQLDSVTIDAELKEIDVLQKGDILAVRSNGNNELIGRCVLAGVISGKTSHSGFTIRIRIEREDIYHQFIVHYLKSKELRKQLAESGGGISISSLNQQGLSLIMIRYPSFSEQKAIVAKIDKLVVETQRLEAIYRQKLAALTELKQSILQKAFTGELTADQEAP